MASTERFSVKRCKTRRAWEAELRVPASLDLDALSRRFHVEAHAGVALVLTDFGGVVVHRFGKLTFKTAASAEEAARAAAAIYDVALPETFK
jgi:hypothetical protein